MPSIFKSRIGHGELSTEVQEPTSMMNAVAGGAAAAGGLAFLLCQTHCPGGLKGAIGGMLGAINPMSLFSKKDEKDAKDEENAADSMEKLQKQVDTIEKQLCSMNCKLTSMVGAAAGAAAGHAYNKYKNRGGGGGGKGGMGKGGMGGFQMLDDWTAPPFFVFMKQLADMQKDVNQANCQVRRLCFDAEEPKAKEKSVVMDFM